MADGRQPLSSLPGKVDVDNALVVFSQAVSGTPGPATGMPVVQLSCAVTATNELKVTFG